MCAGRCLLERAALGHRGSYLQVGSEGLQQGRSQGNGEGLGGHPEGLDGEKVRGQEHLWAKWSSQGLGLPLLSSWRPRKPVPV